MGILDEILYFYFSVKYSSYFLNNSNVGLNIRPYCIMSKSVVFDLIERQKLLGACPKTNYYAKSVEKSEQLYVVMNN